MRLRVIEVKDGTDVLTEVLVGGKVSNHKGINLPGVAVSVPALSEKDIEDLRFALHLSVDFIALSFVRSAADAEDVRRIMREEGVMLPVIAKIEKPQAIENLDEVDRRRSTGSWSPAATSAWRCPLEEVPFLQKTIIDKARLNAKPVIVATQMLESMISSPAPTRAEVSDVANAVLDGADAVMLSGETSVGEYPVHTVETMARIIMATEAHAMRAARGRHDADLPWDPHTRVRRDRQGRRRGGRAGRREVRRRLHPVRRLGPADVPAPRPGPGPGLHARGQGPLAAGPDLGRRDVQDRRRSSTPTRWSRQVDEQLLNIGRVEEGDLVVIIAGSPARHPRLHQRAAHPPDGRRGQRGGAGVPPAQLLSLPSIPAAGAERGDRGAPGGIRTHTEWCLRPSPLPLGYRGCARKGYPKATVHRTWQKSSNSLQFSQLQ